jgi:RNA polymerase sigma-70 factor (ECF subfamily)
MVSGRSSKTSSTLLLRLRDLDDTEAWNEFLECYGPKIFGWCRRYQLQESDASDITQEVLSKLIRAMRTFAYDPSRGTFRGWLKTVTANAIRDFLKGLSRSARGSGDTRVHNYLASIQDPQALEDLANVIEREGERELLREAEERVKTRVKAHTWNVYMMTVLQSREAAETAEELNLPIADVYVAKSRVLKMLKAEVEKLNRSGAGAN